MTSGSQTKRPGRFRAGVGVIAAAALLAPAAASAGLSAGGWSYYGASDAGGGYFSLSPGCSPGEHVVSGGIASGFFSRMSPLDGPDGDHAPDDAWAVDSYHSGSETTYAFAICSEDRPVYESKGKDVAAGTNRRVMVRCPTGTKVIGGGGRISPASATQAVFHSSHPYDANDSDTKPDDGWSVRLHTEATPINLKAHAICMDGVRPKYGHDTGLLPPNGSTSPELHCPETHHIVGMGASSQSDADKSFITQFEPKDDDDGGVVPDDLVEYTITNNTPGVSDLGWGIDAICLPDL